MIDYKLVPNLQQIVTEALVGMVSGVTQMVPPADEPLPDFIQAPIDRAVTRIRSEIDLHAAAAPAPVERNQCDGCQAGIPVENGMHRMGKPDGYADLMACAADRYGAAPAVQGEPVATIHVDGSFVHVAWRIPAPSRCAMDVYTAPQPAEQQPAPDVAGLVEELTELCDEIDNHEIHAVISKTNILWFKRKARAALAAHRKQGTGHDNQ